MRNAPRPDDDSNELLVAVSTGALPAVRGAQDTVISMPNFSNPFVGNVPDGKMTLEELVRAMRLNVAAEEEATFLYMAHAEATDHPLAKKVLIDIANEERVHVGEFNRLIQLLTGDEDKWFADGAAEVDEMAAELAGPGASEPAADERPKTTVGSLKE